MSRKYRVYLSKLNTALVFGPGEEKVGFPDEVIGFSYDARGLVSGTRPIRGWGDALEALNQFPDARQWFGEGDTFTYAYDERLMAIYDGASFNGVEIG